MHQNLHAKRPPNTCHSPADGAVANQTQREAVQFHQGLFPVTKIRACTPITGTHAGIVQGRLRGELKNQGKGHLRDGFGAVTGNVGHRNASGRRGGGVDHIVASGQDADILQLRQHPDDLGGYEGFVGKHNLRLSRTVRHRRRRCTIVYG